PPEAVRAAREIGRADRLMRLLRVLRRALVEARLRRPVLGAVILLDEAAGRGDRLVGERDAVGPHIGDEADRLAAEIDALVEPLRQAHRPAGAEAELARGFLLQGRGGEGRLRVAADLLALDLGDGEAARPGDGVGGGARLGLAAE